MTAIERADFFKRSVVFLSFYVLGLTSVYGLGYYLAGAYAPSGHPKEWYALLPTLLASAILLAVRVHLKDRNLRTPSQWIEAGWLNGEVATTKRLFWGILLALVLPLPAAAIHPLWPTVAMVAPLGVSLCFAFERAVYNDRLHGR